MPLQLSVFEAAKTVMRTSQKEYEEFAAGWQRVCLASASKRLICRV